MLQTPSKIIHHHSHSMDDLTITHSGKQATDSSIHSKTIQSIKQRSQNKKSPILCSITRQSKSKKRSHSFSNSRTFSHQNHSKAYNGRLPTNYSPSITHYDPSQSVDNPYNQSPEITPPPNHAQTEKLSLPPSRKSIKSPKSKRMRTRSHSHSQSLSVQVRDKKTVSTPSANGTNKEYATMNIRQILKMSEEKESIEINNGKSFIFSSWFTSQKKEENINEDDIASAIQSMHDINSSDDSSDGVIKEKLINQTFTTTLKSPKKYTNDKSEDSMMTFRDFLARENQKALQREIVNKDNIKQKKFRPNDKRNFDRFYISKGNSLKVDNGISDGPYTLYKFIITFKHPHGTNSNPTQKKNAHWSIKKRYSDFVSFNNNLIAELKGSNVKDRSIKLPKLPPKTFTKNFNLSFVSHRHELLQKYLNKIIRIRQLASSVTLLTFLGALTNHTLPYNDRFLESRMTLSVYVSNYADTGDVILFETKSYIAASLRSVTASNYDHVAFVYRDVDGTHQCIDSAADQNGLYLVESTIDGVRTYPLKNRLKQWSLLCPQIVVRRLKLLKAGIQCDENCSNSLNALESYTKYDYVAKNDAFYLNAKQFVQRVNGCDYAIWTNVFRLNDVPFEKQTSFFCSQLVTAFLKFMQLLPQNVKTNRILPGMFGNELANNIKLPLKNCVLMPECLLLFKMPAVGTHRRYR